MDGYQSDDVTFYDVTYDMNIYFSMIICIYLIYRYFKDDFFSFKCVTSDSTSERDFLALKMFTTCDLSTLGTFSFTQGLIRTGLESVKYITEGMLCS